jgi:hypothetical protein
MLACAGCRRLPKNEGIRPNPEGPRVRTAEDVFAKAAWRLIPFLGVLYVTNFLDRVNVGFAALSMNRDLSLSPEIFGFGAGIFFIGYFLCEVPSNLILERIGARPCRRRWRSPGGR